MCNHHSRTSRTLKVEHCWRRATRTKWTSLQDTLIMLTIEMMFLLKEVPEFWRRRLINYMSRRIFYHNLRHRRLIQNIRTRCHKAKSSCWPATNPKASANFLTWVLVTTSTPLPVLVAKVNLVNNTVWNVHLTWTTLHQIGKVETRTTHEPKWFSQKSKILVEICLRNHNIKEIWIFNYRKIKRIQRIDKMQGLACSQVLQIS